MNNSPTGDFCFIFQAAWDSKNTIFIAHLQSQTQKEKAAVSYSGAFFGHEKARRKRYIACDELGWGDKTDPPENENYRVKIIFYFNITIFGFLLFDVSFSQKQ